MRSALADLDFGELSKRLRGIVPLRQEDMAELTGLSQGYLSRLEAGRTKLTHVDRIVEFLDAIGAPAELVSLPLRSAATNNPQQEPLRSLQPYGDVDQPWTAGRMVAALKDAMRGEPAVCLGRRRFLVLSGTALSAFIHQWGIADAEPLERALNGAKVPPVLVKHLHGTTNTLRTMDASAGSGPLADMARGHLRVVVSALENAKYDEATGRQLAGIAADTATQLGWFHFDAGHHDAAQRTLLAALRAAHASGDPRYGAGALSYLAIQSYSVGNPRDAVAVMQAARDKVRGVRSPALEAMLLTRQARGHAKLGESQPCLRALGRATELAEQGSAEQDPGWLYWMNTGEVLGQTASCHLELGEYRRAADYFQQANDSLNPADVRTRALFASRAASAHLLSGDRDGGFAAADSALTLAAGVQSARLTEHLEKVVSEVKTLSDPRAAELVERSKYVMTAKES
ncbi:helix-turn-helix transcriptional regulator [Kitasatospora sp. MAA19]|uniref:helix-turn-helix domain-containing protein n=1 Tax=Kitasatospora sp. MAA19 TaxID=3035090 RepID=UPI002473011C|nr:helix-turn-helix transcriptional regulator [Kitasatospora sp. MAA19]